MRLGMRGTSIILENLPYTIQSLILDDNVAHGNREGVPEFFECLANALERTSLLLIFFVLIQIDF